MALEYRVERSLPRDTVSELRTELLERSRCAILHYLDETACGSVVICFRFGAKRIEHPDDIIQSYCAADEQSAIDWMRTFEPPPGMALFDYLYGSKQDFKNAFGQG